MTEIIIMNTLSYIYTNAENADIKEDYNMNDKNYQEISTFLGILVSKFIITNENIHDISNVVSNIVNETQISNFNLDLKQVFLIVSSALYDYFTFSQKLYVKSIICLIVLNCDCKTLKTIISEFQSHFDELTSLDDHYSTLLLDLLGEKEEIDD